MRVLGASLRTVLQEYLTVRYQTFIRMGIDGHVGTGDLGVISAGNNDLGGIGLQLLRMVVDSKVS